jgi:TetR/AcrR family acrAB operon transcriptional repressor
MARKTKAEAEETRREIIKAARAVFHRCGVTRTSLERVAQDARVTRGAIYWHFHNKAELFFAMREESEAELDRVVALLHSTEIENPLDAIEDSIHEFIAVLENSEKVRQTFEIMTLRCEYVDEFADVLLEVNRPCQNYLTTLKSVYAAAMAKGFLKEDLDPDALAYDTVSFVSGLFNNWLSAAPDDDLRVRAHEMIRSHIALRRR